MARVTPRQRLRLGTQCVPAHTVLGVSPLPAPALGQARGLISSRSAADSGPALWHTPTLGQKRAASQDTCVPWLIHLLPGVPVSATFQAPVPAAFQVHGP